MAPPTIPPPSGAEAAAPRLACPSCGVAVTPGYVKCPRCHAALPKVPRTVRHTGGMVPGGTAVGGTGDDDASGPPWLLLLGGGTLVVALVAWLVMRDTTPAAPAPVVLPATSSPSAAPPPAGEQRGDAPGVATAAEVASAGPSVEQRQAAALGALDVRLRRDRLWAKLEQPSAGTLRIVSALCEEPELSAAVAEQAGALVEAGVGTVECRARHGGLVWTKAATPGGLR